MFNFILYKKEIKKLWKTLIVFIAILSLYVTMIIEMFDPEKMELLDGYVKVMPELMSAVGMQAGMTTLVGFMSSYLYGFILIVVPAVFSILCSCRLIARYVDRDYMVSLLAAPVKRITIVFTQMVVLLSGILLIWCYVYILEIVVAQNYFPGELDFSKLMSLNFGLLALQLFVAGVCFFTSCYYDDTKNAIGVGGGLVGIMYVLQMLANTGESMEKFKYATFFTLFDRDGIIASEAVAAGEYVVLFIGAVVLFCMAAVVFSKKDLHI